MSNLDPAIANQLPSQVDTTSLLGGAVEDFTRQSIGNAVGGEYATTDPVANIQNSLVNGNKELNVGTVASATGLSDELPTNFDGRVLKSSAYAADVVPYAPKSRFIFKVKFVFNAPYAQRMNREFMYVVKNIDKPTVNFDYDDVNMYNYRTKVLRTVRHEPLGMTFHDDIQNRVLDFFNAYRTAYSPISNIPDGAESLRYENSSMDFAAGDTGQFYTSNSGLIEGSDLNKNNVLQRIELYQVYGHGSRQNVFMFINPKIDNFDFDNVDHESSDGNALSVSFAYDSLYIKDETVNGTPGPIWGSTDIVGNSETTQRVGVEGQVPADGSPKSSEPKGQGATNNVDEISKRSSVDPTPDRPTLWDRISDTATSTASSILGQRAQKTLSKTLHDKGVGGLNNQILSGYADTKVTSLSKTTLDILL